jgi:ankyrin repeat protein
MLLDKVHDGKTAWHVAVAAGHIKVVADLWISATEVHIKPEELRDMLLLSQGLFRKTPWHVTAEVGNVEILEKLWEWAKEQQLKPEELRNDVILSKDSCNRTP